MKEELNMQGKDLNVINTSNSLVLSALAEGTPLVFSAKDLVD